ncbi:hypothetical protein [Streptomyces anandii]|uniref:hypothetical protein n=1 Tax=Streptomyces anandii TaxID=285454 RepID=UPI0016778531|nr:hypothetical protein [Streptomyces anandii]GGX87255.1 hypothetical protein GCM10010510_35540 [Streptomyces anandii JCM 4720]
MRRTTPHRITVAAAAATTLLLAGCGAQNDGKGSAGSATASAPAGGSSSTSASPTPSASGSVPPSVTPSDSASASRPATPSGCTGQSELTAADSGRTVCLTAGGQLRLTLDGTKDRPWTPVKATGTALKAANPGFVIQPGDAVAAFDAVAPGTARLTSSRPLCATHPGQVSCKGVQEWSVTVRVTAP